MRRMGMAGGGALALTLIGCDEDDSRPAAPTQDAPAAVSQQVTPAVEDQQVQQTAAEPVDQQSEQTTRPSALPSQPQQAGQAGQPEPAAERRLLVRKVVGDGYELEDPDFAPVDGARADFGEIEGAGYRIELPEEWNGELVLWAHGFRGLNDEGTGFSRRLTFDEIPARDVILGQGYG